MRGCVATSPEDVALASNIARDTAWQGHVIKKTKFRISYFCACSLRIIKIKSMG